MSVTVKQLQRRIRVALGQEAGDVVLSGGQVVNVFTGHIEKANVVLADGWIAGVGPYDWQAREQIPIDGAFLVPGLIDSHMHLESTLLLPAELARLVVPRGTTATLSDSHEIGNVLGVAGIDLLIQASTNLPFDLFFMASSCVPATGWEDAGATLGPAEVRKLLSRPRVLGLAEMMDVPAVLRGERGVLEKVRAALQRDRPLDGHAPSMSGRDLVAYVAAGIRSDHESSTVAEARAKAALGMLVQVRQGSTAQNLDALLPLLVNGELGDDWTLVTDDILPDDLQAKGHLDHLLQRLVAGGVPAAQAVRHATLVPARHYGLHDRGAIAPGYRADVVAMEDLHDFRPRLVFKDGLLVAHDGTFLAELPPSPTGFPNTIRPAAVEDTAFRLPLRQATCPVIRIQPGLLVTRAETQTVASANGHWQFDPGQDVLLLASIERHKATGRIGLGLVAGFGLQRGAIGSSVAHDSHNLIVAGTNPGDMLACVWALQDTGGGFVVVADGAVQALVPLPLAGLLSTEPATTVCQQLAKVRRAAANLGCVLPCPFGILSFLALPVIPELRITDRGLWDVTKQQMVQL